MYLLIDLEISIEFRFFFRVWWAAEIAAILASACVFRWRRPGRRRPVPAAAEEEEEPDLLAVKAEGPWFRIHSQVRCRWMRRDGGRNSAGILIYFLKIFRNDVIRCGCARMKLDSSSKEEEEEEEENTINKKKDPTKWLKKKKVRSALQILFDATLSIFQSLWISIYLWFDFFESKIELKKEKKKKKMKKKNLEC